MRFTEIAKHDSRFSVAELQRQFAYDRILSRCFFADDADRWMLKGAEALLARLPVARHSKDIDLYYAECAAAPDASVAALARAADRDVGDHFRFELTKTTPLQETGKGRRVHLSAYLGSLYATFHVDVVVDTCGRPPNKFGPTAAHAAWLSKACLRPLPQQVACGPFPAGGIATARRTNVMTCRMTPAKSPG